MTLTVELNRCTLDCEIIGCDERSQFTRKILQLASARRGFHFNLVFS
jgi:hypothetical protein